MSHSRIHAFAKFVRTSGRSLIEPINASCTFHIAIRGGSGAVLTGTDFPSPACACPITVDGEFVGSVEADVSSVAANSLCRALADQLAIRFVNEHDLDRMTDRLSLCYDELNLVFQLTQAPDTEESFEQSCRRHLQDTAELIGDQNIVLFLAEGSRVLAARADEHPVDRAVATLVTDSKRLEDIHETLSNQWQRNDGRDSVRAQGATVVKGQMVSYVAVPIVSRSLIPGFVGAFTATGCTLPETGDVRLIECLAQQLSSSVTTQNLVTELRDVLFNTVRALIATIDAKDPYTRGHSERVYRLSTEMGKRLGLDPVELQSLAWSALLHDIGKIAIPNDILCKPGQLTPDEYEVVKTHPERGCRVIENIPQFNGALGGIRHHHERVDGKGYPDGLQGHDIPLMGRIIAVADTYDAMVTSRAYRSARTVNETLTEIQASSGSQLDPEIVDVFLQIFAEGEIEDSFEDVDDIERSAA